MALNLGLGAADGGKIDALAGGKRQGHQRDECKTRCHRSAFFGITVTPALATAGRAHKQTRPGCGDSPPPGPINNSAR
ncbi:hypothetical protein GCM10017322_20880 [Paracoccus aerius]|nr:hypothetical protein GCM10017322_20880 [Paracoccus aerius]